MFGALSVDTDRDRPATGRGVSVVDKAGVGLALAALVASAAVGAGFAEATGSAERFLVPKLPKAKYLLETLGADQQLAPLALELK